MKTDQAEKENFCTFFQYVSFRVYMILAFVWITLTKSAHIFDVLSLL